MNWWEEPGAPQPPAEYEASSVAPREAWRLLWSLARAHRLALLLAAGLSLAAAALALVQPLLVQRIIDATLRDERTLQLVLLLTAVFLLEAAVSGVQSFVLERTGEGVVLNVRTRLIRKLLRLPIPELDRRPTGDLLSRAGTDTTMLRAMVTSGAVDATGGVVGLVGSLVLMALIDWVLLLIVFGTIVAGGILVVGVLAGIRTWTERAQARVGSLTTGLERVLGAMRTVRASRAEDREIADLGEHARSAYFAGVRVAKLEALASPAMTLAAQGSFVLVLGLGGARVASGAMTIGELVAFLLYLTFLVLPVIIVLQSVTSLQKGIAALSRIEEVLQLPDEDDEPGRLPDEGAARPRRPDEAAVVATAAVLELRDVHFTHADADSPVLNGMSIEVSERGRVALVGLSGAGKTTLLGLVERFYEPDSGEIRLAGRDLRDISRGECRSQIGYVQQEAPVLRGTLRSNLTYAAPEADPAELDRLLELTNLTELVACLPDGLDTEVGDKGELLSGGERQRIAIVRALLARPRVLLLDEPTAHLDAENELALIRTLEHAAGDCALLIVAHRLSTVRLADRIYVLQDGRAVAAGTHAELLKDSPAYRRLAQGQLAGQPSNGADIRVAGALRP
jgi:ABC-type multidrug transport system fused ATPase/permease subunit